MTSKFIYKVIRIKQAFELIIIIYKQGKRAHKKNPWHTLIDRGVNICIYLVLSTL